MLKNKAVSSHKNTVACCTPRTFLLQPLFSSRCSRCAQTHPPPRVRPLPHLLDPPVYSELRQICTVLPQKKSCVAPRQMHVLIAHSARHHLASLSTTERLLRYTQQQQARTSASSNADSAAAAAAGGAPPLPNTPNAADTAAAAGTTISSSSACRLEIASTIVECLSACEHPLSSRCGGSAAHFASSIYQVSRQKHTCSPLQSGVQNWLARPSDPLSCPPTPPQ